jgi:hypothetical protein
VIFPLLGHATWHAYAAMCPSIPEEEHPDGSSTVEAALETPS